MCAILGVLSSRRRIDSGTVASALALMAHRGPDGTGLWIREADKPPFAAFGHRRLAVIDLSEAASQPMATEDGIFCITYNGEIYNYIELRQELEAKGYSFRTKSDTEVILRAYQAWGRHCLGRFNGVFAFAIWDDGRRELFAARDRFGEKPFHYVWNRKEGIFAFASEIKSLLALPWVAKSRDEHALYRFVAFGELAGSRQTLWQQVSRLSHAHWLSLSWDGSDFELTMKRYWDIDLRRKDDASLETASKRFAGLFTDSVRIRLRSDVPVGTSLSGGIDSSSVAFQVYRLGASAGQKAFSARMDDPAIDEGRYMAAAIAGTGIKRYEVWPSAEELRMIFPKLCYYLEEPFFNTSLFAQHLVMRLANQHNVTVLLDGQGSDETLAGYPFSFSVRYAELARDLRLAEFFKEMAAFTVRHFQKFPVLSKELFTQSFPGICRIIKQTKSGDIALWFRREWINGYADIAAVQAPAAGRDALTQRLYADTMQGALQELLRYGDRNSMAWSREVRFPFLDHRLVEFIFALPVDYKLSNGQTKVILRQAMRGIVPEVILSRQDKLGYQAPLSAWLNGPLKEWSQGKLEEFVPELGGCISADIMERYAKIKGRLDDSLSKGLFTILTLGESFKQMRNCNSRTAKK